MTFSVVLAVPAAGLLAAGTASRSLGVGNAVPAVWPGVGAVVSQAWTNPSLRGRLLARLVDGAAPETAVAAVPELDPGHALRQVALVAADGRSASRTGADCTPWAGARPVGREGAMAGLACANLVTGEHVLTAMADAAAAAEQPQHALDLARLVVGILAAGQQAGGDARGQQSAALVVGAGAGQDWQPPDLAVDLRVDDHERPLRELARLVALVTPRTG